MWTVRCFVKDAHSLCIKEVNSESLSSEVLKRQLGECLGVDSGEWSLMMSGCMVVSDTLVRSIYTNEQLLVIRRRNKNIIELIDCKFSNCCQDQSFSCIVLIILYSASFLHFQLWLIVVRVVRLITVLKSPPILIFVDSCIVEKNVSKKDGSSLFGPYMLAIVISFV